MLGSICPELGVAPLVDPGTDCEDELPIPAGPPADVGHEMDSELQKVFIDVVSLPTMGTPVSDMDGALRVPQAECPVIAPPAVSAFVIRPSMATSPAGPKTFVAGIVSSITGVGGCFAGAQNVSGGSCAGGFHVVQCSGDEPDSTGD